MIEMMALLVFALLVLPVCAAVLAIVALTRSDALAALVDEDTVVGTPQEGRSHGDPAPLTPGSP
jgi:hypothetical protein